MKHFLTSIKKIRLYIILLISLLYLQTWCYLLTKYISIDQQLSIHAPYFNQYSFLEFIDLITFAYLSSPTCNKCQETIENNTYL